jgi:hypothetical protein
MSDTPVESSSVSIAVEPSATLDALQQIALSALTAGATIRQAASKAGVHRNTVTRWLRADAAFRAAYNTWRHEVIASTRTRVLGMANAAATAVLSALQMGDARIGLALLRDLGLTRPARGGQTETPLLREQIEIALDNLEARVAEARFTADLGDTRRRRLRDRIGPRPALPAPQVQEPTPVPVLAPEAPLLNGKPTQLVPTDSAGQETETKRA